MNDHWFSISVSGYKLEEKIPSGSSIWKDFNASFHNVELQPQNLMNCVYMGRAITTHHKDSWRVTSNYLQGQHIGLDFDSENKFSSIDHLKQDKFISRYASFIHTTISHTPEKPRARVLFLLDKPIMQAKNYSLAANALLWLFGTADKQCKDAVRFFYGAPGCTFEFIDGVLPLNVLKRIIDQYQETGKIEKRKSSRKDYVPETTEREVAAALNSIPPWQIDYDEWLSVLMAIHAEFGDGGYSLAESWAAGRAGEVAQKFKGFKSSGNEIGRITVGTLFSIAQRFGWSKFENAQ